MDCVGKRLLCLLQTFLLEVVDKFLDSILCRGSGLPRSSSFNGESNSSCGLFKVGVGVVLLDRGYM